MKKGMVILFISFCLFLGGCAGLAENQLKYWTGADHTETIEVEGKKFIVAFSGDRVGVRRVELLGFVHDMDNIRRMSKAAELVTGCSVTDPVTEQDTYLFATLVCP